MTRGSVLLAIFALVAVTAGMADRSLAHGGGHARNDAKAANSASAVNAASSASHAPADAVPADPIEAGAAALSEHRFSDALAFGLAARASARDARETEIALAIIVDACIETGRYEAAAETLETLVDAHPGLAALARLSYMKELHGDVAGALEAMRGAAAAGADAREIAWCRVKIAELALVDGDTTAAKSAVGLALFADPSAVEPLALLGRLDASRGEWEAAITRYRHVLELHRDSGVFIALGEALEASGDTRAARVSYDAARGLMQEDATAGTDVELELIALEIDHPAQGAAAVPVADLLLRARALRERRPTIFADALLAEVLARAGRTDEALAAAERALRLRSRDPLLLYRAALACRGAGDDRRAAELLGGALLGSCALGPCRTAAAKELLVQLQSWQTPAKHDPSFVSPSRRAIRGQG